MARDCSSRLQAKLLEAASQDYEEIPLPQELQSTQIEQQKLLNPAEGLLNLFGLPERRGSPPPQVKHSQDGSNYPTVAHSLRKHLTTMPKGWGAVTPPSLVVPSAQQSATSECKGSSAPERALNPNIDPSQLLYRASALPLPREFGSGNKVALLSGHAPTCLGTRTDQGRRQGQMVAVTGTSHPRPSALSVTGLPQHPQASCRAHPTLDDYAHTNQHTQRYQPPSGSNFNNMSASQQFEVYV